MPPTLQKEFKVKKKDRRSLTFQFKMQVLKRIESGVHRTSVAKELGLAESTVRYIVKNSEKIKDNFTELTCPHKPQRYYARVNIYVALEKHLYAWIEEMGAKNMTPVTPAMIKSEAKRVFKELKKSHKGPESFNASIGWYAKFVRTAKERNFDITGRTSYIPCTDFPTKLIRCIGNNAYTPKLVFNLCVSELYWKRLPQCVSILEGKSNYVCNDHITLLLGCNADGEALLPPLAVSCTSSSVAERPIEGKDIQGPIVWRSSEDGQLTKEIFKDWYINCFCPFFKSYCAKNQLEHKTLLLLDSSLCHRDDVRSMQADLHTEVLLMPKDVRQPLNQGAIATFKAMYIYRVIEQLIHDIHAEVIQQDLEAVSKWLASFDIVRSLRMISETWMSMEPAVMNGVWSELWPSAVVWPGPVSADKDALVGAIVDKIKALSLGNITVHEIESLLSSRPLQHENLSVNNIDDDIFPIEEDYLEEDVDSECVTTNEKGAFEEHEEHTLTPEVLEIALNHIDAALNLFVQHDSDPARVASVMKTVTDGVSCYKELLDSQMGKPKQNAIYKFLKSVTNKPAMSVTEVSE